MAATDASRQTRELGNDAATFARQLIGNSRLAGKGLGEERGGDEYGVRFGSQRPITDMPAAGLANNNRSRLSFTSLLVLPVTGIT